MLLYATITSERASKSQGGEYLNINVTNEKREIEIRLHITKGIGNLPCIAMWSKTKPFIFEASTSVLAMQENPTKGKQKKDEDTSDCIYDHDHGDGSECEYNSI